MTSPTLFIGVITHEKSQYGDSRSETGLAFSLAQELTSLCGEQQLTLSGIRINTENLYQGDVRDLSERESLGAELHVEHEWAQYLDRPDKGNAWVTRQIRKARFLTRPKRHWSGASVIRLLNIELSHRDVWQAGIDSGADWILVLEDDAYCSNPGDLAQGIALLVNGPAHGTEFSFINLSASFSSKILGVKHLLKISEDFRWQGVQSRAVYSSSKPVTNTVCALLYSRNYLRTLVSVWDSLPMSPVLPIDWKMNRAIMRMQAASGINLGETLWIEPAPILQRSMHPVGT